MLFVDIGKLMQWEDQIGNSKNLTGKPARKQTQKGCNGTDKFHEKGKGPKLQ